MNSPLETEKKPVYINLSNSTYFSQLSHALYTYLEKYLPVYQNQLVIVCIGTDRATGDSLGPLIGYKLGDLHFQDVALYGTLENPVHAKNLDEVLDKISVYHPHSLVIAIDACLGSMENVGCVSIGEGSIKPGAGVKKDLPPIGHLHITGIVNFSSLMNMVILQNTRLSLVMNMADAISSSLRYCLWKYYKKRS